MSETLATVRVKRDGPRGWHTINECDFDPAVHELYDDDAQGAGDAMPQPEAVIGRPRGRPPGSRNKYDGGAA